MAFVVMPSTLRAAIVSRTFTLLTPAQYNPSQWGGKAKIVLLSGIARWRASLSLRPLATEEEIRVARAFFYALEGIANTFEVPYLPSPQSETISTTASSSAAAGTSVVSVQNAVDIEAGMPVSITLPTGHKRLSIVTSKASNSLTLKPSLPEAISSGAQVQIADPVAHVRMANPSFSYTDQQGQAGFSFDVMEAPFEAAS